ncbi:hypothetical protein KBI52_15005 [Microvirga sp. HBU67558]|uniref:hypothetical protein n=1 Tax=Microvirga TaxID=186650 RepID=UPI001B3591DF|nr:MULTISPECIES: hypothetical protein [unclassified Microvirga]MBQ0821508.1 hypothetical protein [Microvirga sp. HBU67558]
MVLEPVELRLTVFDPDMTLREETRIQPPAGEIHRRQTKAAVTLETQPTMSMEPLREGWSSISIAPRDGVPVILWMIEDEAPPAIPQSVGYWMLNPKTGIGYWRLFGDPPRFCSDRQIRAWKQLLRD